MSDLINLTINGKAVKAAPGTLIINAAKQVGIEIPSFCYYDGLALQAACRMCLVEVEKTPKLQVGCTLPVTEVTFQYKNDSKGVPQFGLIAEEVAQVNPDLVVRDEKGEIYTVRYDAVNAMLLNEFLKQHGTVQEQETTISQLKSTVATQEANAAQQGKEIKALTASLKEQASQIQKVSAELEMNKAAPRVVNNQ